MTRRFVAALLVLVAAAGCGDLLDPAAAVVYGKKITVDRVESQLAEYVASRTFEQLAAEGDAGALKRQFEQEYLTRAIMRAALTPAAEERGIVVTEQDVTERIHEIVESDFGGSQAQFEEAMKEQGLTQRDVHAIVHDRLLEDALRADVVADAAPDEEDLRAYYEGNPAEFELTRSRHILVEEEGRAAELAERLRAAPRDRVEDLFAELARKHSIDPTARDNGGDLGYQPPGAFVAPFERTLARLEEGALSDPVRTQFGWHVIQVTDRRTQTFDEARSRIASQLMGTAQDDAWREFLRSVFEEAEVKVNPRYGEFDEETFRVVDPDAADVPGAEEAEPSPEPSVPALPVPAPPPPG